MKNANPVFGSPTFFAAFAMSNARRPMSGIERDVVPLCFKVEDMKGKSAYEVEAIIWILRRGIRKTARGALRIVSMN